MVWSAQTLIAKVIHKDPTKRPGGLRTLQRAPARTSAPRWTCGQQQPDAGRWPDNGHPADNKNRISQPHTRFIRFTGDPRTRLHIYGIPSRQTSARTYTTYRCATRYFPASRKTNEVLCCGLLVGIAGMFRSNLAYVLRSSAVTSHCSDHLPGHTKSGGKGGSLRSGQLHSDCYHRHALCNCGAA